MPIENNDWVVMPYRIAEACRLSLFTLGSHPDIPENVRWWIAQWLQGYNMALAFYFNDTYGEDIFPTLEEAEAAAAKA